MTTPVAQKEQWGMPEEPGFGTFTPEEWALLKDIVTEDDEPVDGIFAERQQRLLPNSLHASWSGPGEGRSFLALANVGLFYDLKKPPLVPDVLVSLDVHAPPNVRLKHHHSYFVRLYGKPPDVVIEIVSRTKRGEMDTKLSTYAEIGVPYYVVFDPDEYFKQGILHVYGLQGQTYHVLPDNWLPDLGLGLTLWEGEIDGIYDHCWLRWCDQDGNILLTGDERADQEYLRREWERKQKEWERKQKERALSLAEQERLLKEQERQEKERAFFLVEQERLLKEQERLLKEQERLLKEQERQEKERVLLLVEQERQEKERVLLEKNEQVRITACNLLPLLTDEQISQITGLLLEEVRKLREA